MVMRVVPWMTDDAVGFMCAFIEWFKCQNGSLPDVLEFGMGSSTLFFADRSKRLVSYEHDPEWHERVLKMLDVLQLPHRNAVLAERPYSARVSSDVCESVFDIVSIDGRDRVSCLEEVLRLNLLSESGIVVLDNTERITTHRGRYAKMAELLVSDFNVVHFEQLGRDRAGWNSSHRWITSIAWRRNGLQFSTKGRPV